MKKNEWVLLVVAAAGTQLTPVQLQKMLFLLGKNVSKKILGADFYTFEPYDYGPFCKEIYSDADALEQSGCMDIKRPPEVRYNEYSVTKKGAVIAKHKRGELPDNAVDYLDRLATYVKQTSFSELVGAIYKAYPEMRVNSVFNRH